MSHFLEELKIRFPRLCQVEFTESERDEYFVAETPAGQVETLYFYERCDFENAVIALAYKLELREIPKSMGAIFISGLLDHQAKEKISMVIISRGGYSGISSEKLTALYTAAGGKNQDIAAGLPEEKWYELSRVIRTDHELAHFVQRRLFPENKDAVRDEIKADMTGIISALGYYDSIMAKVFLGTEGTQYRPGGRLENYTETGQPVGELKNIANAYIDALADCISDQAGDAFEILIKVEDSETGKSE